MEILYISSENFNKLLEKLSKEFDIYAPVKFSAPAPLKESPLHFERFDPAISGKIVVGEIRPSEPLKSFLNYSRERIDASAGKKQLLVGVKACDLNSLAIQDFVFKQNDPPDPFYIHKRENTFIISSDCDLLYENCFCTAAGNTPYRTKGFDLNLSCGYGGYLAEIGSDKADKLVGENETFFSREVDANQIKERDDKRKEFTDSLKAQVCGQGVPQFNLLKGKMKEKYASGLWEETAKTCVECGACNLVCPTCHCFFISDQKKENLTARFRSWDACLYKRFALVAGGANPRRHLAERLRNRFDKKFDFFPKVLGAYACTGCGRCFEACPGEIDIREILKKLVK